MKNLLLATLAASLLTAACGKAASDAPEALDTTATGTTTTTTTTTTNTPARPRATETTRSTSGATPAANVFLPVSSARTLTIPSGTALQLSLNTAVASDTSRVEDAISAELTNAVVVGGRTVLPAGSTVTGIVSRAEDSGRVKGRASLELDFTAVTTGGSRYAMSADPFSRIAPATKGEDAAKIGVGAGAGAIIGGIIGGKKGAAEGAAVGGGAGTGVVLATKGKEVRLATGTDVSTQLSAPLIVRVAN